VHVKIDLGNAGSEKVIYLFDGTGKMLNSGRTTEAEHVIDMTDNNAGLYILQVLHSSDRSFLKIYKR
jgi:hypothetical protein